MVMRRRSARFLAAAAVLSAVVLAACSGSGNHTSTASTKEPSGPFTLKVAFGSNYVFDTTGLTQKWWKQVAAQFKATHPKATVQFIPIPGSYNDIVNKLSLLYRNPSTAPDVAEIPYRADRALGAGPGYLLPLNTYLTSTVLVEPASRPVVQSEGTFSGKVYAVNQGENDSAPAATTRQIFAQGRDRAALAAARAGRTSSRPRRRSRAKVPGVTPTLAQRRNGLGCERRRCQGINNFIVGSQTPTIYDIEVATSSWWTAPGIRAALALVLRRRTPTGLGARHLGAVQPQRGDIPR